jgi:hypothetical protein
VLGTVKALRVASTAHSARPSGLDDACAQLADGNCVMVGGLKARGE